MSFFDSTYGLLSGTPGIVAVPVAVIVICWLGFIGARLWMWAGALAVAFWILGAPLWVWLVTAPIAILFFCTPLRRAVLTRRAMAIMKSLEVLPEISETERAAIAAGTVWMDGELFSGRPNLNRLTDTPYPGLTEEEQAFLDGPVAQVCSMTEDWETYRRGDLSSAVWDFLRKERFLGLIIPKEYGGLGLSPSANSAVIAKLTTRSMPLAITVMVPNSLGPAELLIHYGTEAQRQHWLPRLARGQELPCFALTEPGAGSDAGSLQSSGEVFCDQDGELKLRLHWDKRYITLATVATVLGLAFRLRDPDNLLGRGEDLGITCALIPTDTPGVVLGRRHDPLGIPFFYNGPTRGHDVVVPVDAIIGGPECAGAGWQMLMECLAAGRGISLPANSTGGAQLVARVTGVYTAVRKQFGLPIGRFEGVEEKLARIGGFTYLLEAARRYTNGALDGGAKPAVVTAIAKYSFTELWRQVVNDGMDVVGGAGICRGPRNLLANAYTGTPISITVEGANILTRTLMIFGQGAIRCHPYAYAEIEALAADNLPAFDRFFWGHVGHVVRNTFRATLLSLSRGHLAASPNWGAARRYWQKLAWSSASFALLADVAMATLGGNLKRREKVAGRFADVLSWMYLGTAVLRRFEAEGRRTEDVPLMRWCMEHAMGQIQDAFDGLYRNMDAPGLGWLLRGPLLIWARLNPVGSGASDRLGHKVSSALLRPGAQRDRLTGIVHVPADESSALGRLERALRLCTDTEPVLRKVREAIRSGAVPGGKPEARLAEAEAAGLISPEEHERLAEAEAARAEAVAVDSFAVSEWEYPGDDQGLDVEEREVAKREADE